MCLTENKLCKKEKTWGELVLPDHRRQMKREEKAKVVASVRGEVFIQFLLRQGIE